MSTILHVLIFGRLGQPSMESGTSILLRIVDEIFIVLCNVQAKSHIYIYGCFLGFFWIMRS